MHLSTGILLKNLRSPTRRIFPPCTAEQQVHFTALHCRAAGAFHCLRGEYPVCNRPDAGRAPAPHPDRPSTARATPPANGDDRAGCAADAERADRSRRQYRPRARIPDRILPACNPDRRLRRNTRHGCDPPVRLLRDCDLSGGALTFKGR